jgi:hypothetical protein
LALYNRAEIYWKKNRRGLVIDTEMTWLGGRQKKFWNFVVIAEKGRKRGEINSADR